jgi:4-diphosphocytidyl-2-C-methyl-D-erythritol kinase
VPKPAVYRSYAKINLYLDVLDRRSDGFNNIETIFQTVSLYDELAVEVRQSGITLSCSDPDLPTNEDNLVYRAAQLLQPTDAGAAMRLTKYIPVAAGLAGGSGNAAAALTALNDLWQLGHTPQALQAMALQLGSDVPYCLTGGTAAATGRGECITSLPAVPETWFILVHPPMAVTAKHAYSHPLLTRNTATPVNGHTPAFQQALQQLRAGKLPRVIFNRFETPIFHDYPELARIKALLRDLGCPAAAMSGSGPTLFGLCNSENQARSVAAGIEGYPTTVVRTSTCGVSTTHHDG